MLTEHVPYSEVGVMESQVAEADTGNPLLRVLEVTRTAEGLVGRLNHFRQLGTTQIFPDTSAQRCNSRTGHILT